MIPRTEFSAQPNSFHGVCSRLSFCKTAGHAYHKNENQRFSPECWWREQVVQCDVPDPLLSEAFGKGFSCARLNTEQVDCRIMAGLEEQVSCWCTIAAPIAGVVLKFVGYNFAPCISL